MPDIQSFQAILDRHRDEDLMRRLRRLAEAGCTGSVVVFNEELLGIVFFTEGAVVDAIVIEGPWQGQGVQAIAFLSNAADAQVLYQPTAHFGERTIEMEWKELEDRVTLLRRLLPSVRSVTGGSWVPDPRALHRPPPRAGARTEERSDRLTDDDFLFFGELLEPADEPRSSAEPHARREERRSSAKGGTSDPEACDTATSPPSAPKSLLDEIREIDGYRASGIMDHTGDLLWTDVPAEVDLPLLAGVFNDVFRTIARVCRRHGLGACATLVVHAEGAAVVVHCSGATREGPHLHAAAVLAPDGNQALMRLQLERALPRVKAALA